MENEAGLIESNRLPIAPTVQRILQLRTRSSRDSLGCFFVEGVRFVLQAVRRRWHLEAIVACQELLVSPAGRGLVIQQKRAGVPWLDLTAAEFRRTTLSSRPQGIAAIVRQRWTPLQAARPADGLCWVALRHVQSTGNLGTLLHTSDAVGAAGLMLLGDDVDPFEPVAIRASMGSLFSQRFVRTSHSKLRQWADRHGCKVVGTAPHAKRSYAAVDFCRPTVLLLGSERKGMSRADRKLCDTVARIPMVGSADSLNLGVAAGILLYEVFRSRNGRR